MKKILCIVLTVLFCLSSILTVSAEEVKWIVKPQYSEICGSDETGNIILVKKGEKYGYIDKNGKILIDFIYDEATIFSKGIAYVEKDKTSSYIDKSGKVVFNLETKNYLDYLRYAQEEDRLRGSMFYGDYAIISSGRGDVFIIDRAGEYVQIPGSALIQHFDINNNIAVITPSRGMGSGYLNIKTGNIVFCPYFVDEFEKGYGIIGDEDGYIQVVDENLENVSEKIFVGDAFAKLSNGIIRLTVYNDEYQPINSSYIDINGKTLIPNEYSILGEYQDGLIAANIIENGISKLGYLDISGNWVIKPIEYFAYSGFFKGIAAFSKVPGKNADSKNFGIIDKTGKFVLQPQFQDFSHDNNYAYAKLNGLWGILDVDSLVNNAVKDNVPKDTPDNWAITEVTKAIENNLVPSNLQNNYKEKITRKDFCDLAISLVESVLNKNIDEILIDKGLSISENKTFSDTSDKNILAAYALSIVNGKGNGLFDPNGHITRQEAAVMLTNVSKSLGFDVNSKEASFADGNLIASWAKDAVNYVSSKDVMKGTNIGFEPKENYTRQQAYITIFRLFDIVK